MFIDITMTFKMHVFGRDHSVTVLFDNPIMGKYHGMYEKNSRLAIMERAVYIYAPPNKEMAY